MAGGEGTAEERTLGQERAEGHGGEVGLMAAVERGGVHSGQEGDVAGTTLRGAGDAKGGVDGAQKYTGAVGGLLGGERAAKERAEARHRRSGKRVGEGGGRQAHTVEEKDDEGHWLGDLADKTRHA
jgi:hypothetical protein